MYKIGYGLDGPAQWLSGCKLLARSIACTSFPPDAELTIVSFKTSHIVYVLTQFFPLLQKIFRKTTQTICTSSCSYSSPQSEYLHVVCTCTYKFQVRYLFRVVGLRVLHSVRVNAWNSKGWPLLLLKALIRVMYLFTKYVVSTYPTLFLLLLTLQGLHLSALFCFALEVGLKPKFSRTPLSIMLSLEPRCNCLPCTRARLCFDPSIGASETW